MVVHHIKMDDVGACGNHTIDLLAQSGEVGGKNTWRNSIVFCGAGHDKVLVMSTKKYEFTILAKSTFLPDQSDIESDRYVFAYTITITNTGEVTAQLVSRHWIITD